jgi:GDPmannose 4,6-dehydratase
MNGTGTAPCCSIVIGAGGQDGQYLCRDLKARGDRVARIGREGVYGDAEPRPIDILNRESVRLLVKDLAPDEIYYLAAHHHSSQEEAGSLGNLYRHSYAVHCTGLLNFLEAMCAVRRQARLFYAASSLVYGNPLEVPQSEDTPMLPTCAYGVTKLQGIGLCRAFRVNEGLFACSGILYNHESPLRAPQFVTRRIANAVSSIHRGSRAPLKLGALDAQVDWSAAEDVVMAMIAMLSLHEPQDFVVGSGVLHSVREFAEHAFSLVGLDYKKFVFEDPALLHRSPRKNALCADIRRIRASTGWQPKRSFEQMIEDMVCSELESSKQ